MLAAGVSHSIRLVDGDKPNRGVVQVYDGISQWGHICCDSWTRYIHNADVVCRYFGYQLASRSYCVHQSITDEASIFIDAMRCPRSADDRKPVLTLEQCTIYSHHSQCFTAKHAAVECVEGECALCIIRDLQTQGYRTVFQFKRIIYESWNYMWL